MYREHIGRQQAAALPRQGWYCPQHACRAIGSARAAQRLRVRGAQAARRGNGEPTGGAAQIGQPVVQRGDRGLRLGFTRVPLYSLLFYCRAVGGELAPHPLETRDVGWFTREALPQPLVGSDRWGEHVFAAINGERRDVLYDSVRKPMWRGESAPS